MQLRKLPMRYFVSMSYPRAHHSVALIFFHCKTRQKYNNRKRRKCRSTQRFISRQHVYSAKFTYHLFSSRCWAPWKSSKFFEIWAGLKNEELQLCFWQANYLCLSHQVAFKARRTREQLCSTSHVRVISPCSTLTSWSKVLLTGPEKANTL